MAADFLEYEDRLRAIPVVHHRIAFAQMVLRALRDPLWRPDVVAIELPPSIGAPAWRNLEEVNVGPLWIGKVVEGTRERDASRQLSGFQHTRAACEAASAVILAARRCAQGLLRSPPDCAIENWLALADQGFEPVLFVGDETLKRPALLENIVLPQRIFLASEAFVRGRKNIAPGLWNAELGGRVWFTPPFYSGDGCKRAQWIAVCGTNRTPRARAEDGLDFGETWLHGLLRRALQHCHRHVLFVAPRGVRPAPDLVHIAEITGRQIIHVSAEDVAGAAWELVVRDEHELDPEPAPGVVDPVMEVYPLHSGDAYLAAMRYARAHHIEVAFVDRELTDIGEWIELRRRSEAGARGQRGWFIEDAVVQEEGLENFYGRQRALFDAARTPEIDAPREKQMAAWLKRFLRQGRRVFFLCGAAHWTAIRQLLDDPSFEEETKEEVCVPGVVLCGGPYAVAGAASDLPRAVYEFETLRRAGREAEFRHLRTARELERRIERRLLKNPAYAPSQIGVFKRYLDRLCRQTGVIVPRHFHWTEAAGSCLGPAGSRVVMQECIKFWRNCPAGVATLRRASLAPYGVVGDFGTAGSFTLTSRWGSPDLLYNVAKGDLGGMLPFYGGASGEGQIFSQDGWEQLMSRMMILAKRHASPRLRAPTASPLGGVLRGTVDGRATARARARGDRRIYEKAVTPQPLNSLSEWEGFDPVVWLFQPDVSSPLETMFVDKPGNCHAVVAGAQHSDLAGSREWRFGLFASWVPRFADADPAMLARLERWLAQGNKAFIPTQRDLNHAGADRGWRRCSLAERVLCVALDRCRTHVVLVSPVQASARVREVFRQRRKRLLHVEMARFDARDIAGLRSPVLIPRNCSPG